MICRLQMVLLLACGLAAFAPPVTAREQPPRGDAKPTPLDRVKLPPGTVIMIVPSAKDVPQNVEGVFLTPDEYRKLVDSAQQAKRTTTDGRPEAPSVCRLRVGVSSAGDSARVEATYRFRADRPRTLIALGLGKARPVAVTLTPGAVPTLIPSKDDDSYSVLVEAVGEYELKVEADVPLRGRGPRGEQGVEFGLPGAAVTVLESTALPRGSVRVRANGRTVPASLGDATALALGPVRSVELAWDAPAAVVPGDPLFLAETTIDARFDEPGLTCTADVRARVIRGSIGEFRLNAPLAARVTTVEPDPGVRIEPPDDPKKPVWIVRRPASTDDLALRVTTVQTAQKRPLAVPALSLSGATLTKGKVSLTTPARYRPNIVARPELIRVEDGPPPENERRDTWVFAAAPAAGIAVECDPQPLRGELEFTVTHALTLGEPGARLASRFDLKPVRRETDRIEIDVPSHWSEPRFLPAEVIDSVSMPKDGPAGRTYTLRLADPARKPFALIVEAVTASPGPFPLPRLLGAVDRGGQLTVAAPGGAEVRGVGSDGDADKPLELQRTGMWGAAFDRAPVRADVGWKSGRGDLLARMTADISLVHDRADVRQTIRIANGPRQLTLRGPARLAGRLRLVDGGALTAVGPGEWLATPATRDAVLKLEYATAVDRDGAVVALPLVWPDPSIRCETTARIWSGLPGRPVVVGPDWSETAVVLPDDAAVWPSIALQTTAQGPPVKLRLEPSAGAAAAVDRVWMRVVAGPEFATVRARLRVRAFRPGGITLVIPDDWSGVEVRLDGRRVGEGLPAGRTDVPVPFDGAVHTIEAIGSTPGGRLFGATPPVVDDARPGPVRWQFVPAGGDVVVFTPANWLPAMRWGWNAGTFVPRAGWSTDDLSRWIGEESAQEVDDPDAATGGSGSAARVGVVAVPRWALMSVMSLATLAAAAAAWAAPWTARRLAAVLIATAALFIAAAWFPMTAGQLVGAAQPALLGLPLLAWAARRPRPAAPESVFAPLAAPAARREPSTLDLPRVTA